MLRSHLDGGKRKWNINLVEHLVGRWLTMEEINSVKWHSADLDLVEKLKTLL